MTALGFAGQRLFFVTEERPSVILRSWKARQILNVFYSPSFALHSLPSAR